MNDCRNVDDCIDDIVASCNGDLRGALKALILVNEQLERELNRAAAGSIRLVGQGHAATAFH